MHGALKEGEKVRGTRECSPRRQAETPQSGVGGACRPLWELGLALIEVGSPQSCKQ